LFLCGTWLHSVGVGPLCDTVCAEMRARGRRPGRGAPPAAEMSPRGTARAFTGG
jgi:hypothetical protein